MSRARARRVSSRCSRSGTFLTWIILGMRRACHMCRACSRTAVEPSRGRLALAQVILDVLSAEGPLGEKSIVSPAEDAKISDGIRAAEGVGLHVVELEEGAGAA